MQIRRESSFFMVVLEPGDEVHAALVQFAENEGVRGGYVSGIGACRDATLGYFDLARKAYVRTGIAQEVEIVSCSGGLALFEGKVSLHLHAVLSDPETRCYGGHLFAATVTASAEFYVFPSANAVVRQPNPEIGLNVIQF